MDADAHPPPLVLLLGLLGLIPFIVTAYLAAAWQAPADLRALTALIAYAAVILSFLGGVHWGFALVELPPSLAGLAPPPPAAIPPIGRAWCWAFCPA